MPVSDNVLCDEYVSGLSSCDLEDKYNISRGVIKHILKKKGDIKLMPLKSRKQWKWMAVNEPEMLKRWQREHAVDYNKLPNKKIAKRKRGKR